MRPRSNTPYFVELPLSLSVADYVNVVAPPPPPPPAQQLQFAGFLSLTFPQCRPGRLTFQCASQLCEEMRPAGLFLSLFFLLPVLPAVTARLSDKDRAFLLSYLGEDFALVTPTDVPQSPAGSQADISALQIVDQHEHHHTHKERHHHKTKGRLSVETL